MRRVVMIAAMLLGVAGAQVPAVPGPVASVPSVKDYAYEVVVVRGNNSGSGNTMVNTNGGRFVATNLDLKSMLMDSYDLQVDQQLIDLPAWANGKHYDINAKMDADTATRLKALKPEDQQQAENKMALGILADRFGLKAHHETRQLAKYALVPTKGGSKLQAADATNAKAGNMSVNNGKMEAYSAEISRLADFLSYRVKRPVVDRTGLTGKYDMALEWTPEELENSGADGLSTKAPGLLTALQEQLGLKLEPIKGPVDVVVIERLVQPTEN